MLTQEKTMLNKALKFATIFLSLTAIVVFFAALAPSQRLNVSASFEEIPQSINELTVHQLVKRFDPIDTETSDFSTCEQE